MHAFCFDPCFASCLCAHRCVTPPGGGFIKFTVVAGSCILSYMLLLGTTYLINIIIIQRDLSLITVVGCCFSSLDMVRLPPGEGCTARGGLMKLTIVVYC